MKRLKMPEWVYSRKLTEHFKLLSQLLNNEIQYTYLNIKKMYLSLVSLENIFSKMHNIEKDVVFLSIHI